MANGIEEVGIDMSRYEERRHRYLTVILGKPNYLEYTWIYSKSEEESLIKALSLPYPPVCHIFKAFDLYIMNYDPFINYYYVLILLYYYTFINTTKFGNLNTVQLIHQSNFRHQYYGDQWTLVFDQIYN